MRGPATWAAGLGVSAALHTTAALALVWSLAPEPVTQQPRPQTRLAVETAQVEQASAAAAEPSAEPAESANTTGTTLAPGSIAESRAAPVAPAPAALPAATPLPQALATLAQPAPRLAAAAPAAPPAPLAEPDAAQVPVVRAEPSALPGLTPEAHKATATLAFSADGVTDPVSLAAVQNFMAPETLAPGANLRDGLSSLLSGIPCARMQVQFNPDSNTLELRGHVPASGLAAPVLAALQEQMGADIRVADNLRILPSPQCDALSGIAATGLAQSTDQITNPLLVGADTYATEFHFSAGQRLILDLSAPDYDAYLYIDYFDSGGQVIHLSPNDSVPLTRAQAKSALRVGADAPGDPGLYITIGPPYGQEIAVAFAASTPLFEGNRPLVEPAGPYLDFLAAQVAAARAADPAFKGEWVYFFVSTAAE